MSIGIKDVIAQYQSPDESFALQCYIEQLANAFTSAPSPQPIASKSKTHRVSNGLHKFVDVVAKEGNESSDSSSYSSTSHSI
jgi:hypothetical protein